MNISDVELFSIELPGRDPVATLLIRLMTDSGLEGWGETRKTWRVAELSARRKGLLALLAGREACDIESILALDALSDRSLACGVEIALWDLVARAAMQPLCQLWGGAYRRRVPLSVRLPHGPADTVAQAARALASQAVLSQIVTSSGSREQDAALVAAIRQSCPDRVQLRLDAGSHYDLAGAAELCEALEPGSVQFVLDPLSSRDREQLAVLNSKVRLPLGVLAGIEKSTDIAKIARTDAASFIIVDPVQVGGLLRARQCAAAAEAVGLAASIRMEATSGLGLAASLQLAAATPSFINGHECSYPKLHDDILFEPLRMVEGMLAVPTAPGLGVEVDRDKVERYLARIAKHPSARANLDPVILLTNDDGVNAPGLAALRRATDSFSTVIVLAPDRPLSGCSHQATTSQPLELTKVGENQYALDGSPVDCTRVGLTRIAPKATWVLAGVNEGGNLGADIYLSGTVAAAREACLLGRSAIALSQYIRSRPIDWDQTMRLARQALEVLLNRPPAPGSFWNVNLPQFDATDDRIPECVFCHIDPNPLPVNYELREGKLHYRARYQDRQRTNGHDVAICFSGQITISQISLLSVSQTVEQRGEVL